MANNRIGIKVQVEFPSVSQMKSDLAEKWKSVKEGFTGKINVDVDKNSLNKMKTQIQTLLNEKTFDIKIDPKHAIASIGKIDKELKQLDERIGKVREIKLQFNAKDLQKSFQEILMASNKIEEEQAKINQRTKQGSSNMEQYVGQYDKIVRKFKLIDGKRMQVQIKTNYTDDRGVQTTRTINKNDNVTEDVGYDREGIRLERLQEIEDIMKRLHQIEKEQITAEGDYNNLLEKERLIQKEQLDMLTQQYQQKYKMNAMDDSGLKELARRQAVTHELKEQQAFNKLLAQEEKEIASDVSKIAQLENKRQQIKMKLVNATQAEKESLRAQLTHYYNIQTAIEETFNDQRKMTDEQQRELTNLRNINQLELERARAKRQQAIDDKQATEAERAHAQEQREANRKVIADLNEIHKLRLKIAEIEGRRDAGGKFDQGEQLKLDLLERELKIKSKEAREVRQLISSQGLLTDSANKQLRTLSEINQQETNRVRSAQNLVASNDKVEAQYKEWMVAEANIARLRRDLIYAGMREKEVILDALEAEQQKSNAIKDSLSAQGKLTSARLKEVEAIKKASNAQLELNNKRRLARERDQSFNDTGGLVDPFTVYANARQGIDMMLEPMVKIDEAFTRVKKVANASDETLQHFKDTSYDTASQLGVTADEYMTAVETWVTAGETFQKSQELAKISQVGSFVGNIEPEAMVKYMSVPMKAFADEGVKANDIINTMNVTANNNAIEMDDLGKAYMRSATTVKTAGMSFDELTGFITGAQEATRMGGERIGTALKAISMNYNLIKSQVTKQQKAKYDFFSSIGINLKDTHSITEAVEKLHGKWKNLKDEEKNTAVYYLAGKEHANVLNGVIAQWDKVIKSEKEAREQLGKGINGSAYIEFAKQSDSVRFKLAHLKSEWMKLMNTLGDSKGFMSDLLGGVIKGLKIASDLAQNESLMNILKIIGAGIVGHAGANLMMRFWDTMKTGGRNAIRGAGELLLAWKHVGREIDVATTKVGTFTKAEELSALAGGLGGKGGKGGGVGTTGTAVAGGVGGQMAGGAFLSMAGRGGAKGLLKGGLKLGLKTGLKAVPYLGEVLMLLDVMGIDVFAGIGKAIDKVTNKTKVSTQEFDTMMKKFKGSNMYINGTVNQEQNGIDDMRKQLVDGGAINKKGKITGGGLEKDQFLKFRDKFNAQAEDLGINVRVKINDTKDIMAKLKLLQEALDKTQAKANKEILVKGAKIMGGGKSGIPETIKEISDLKGQLKLAGENVKTFKKIRDKYPVDSSDYKTWDGYLKNAKKHQSELTKEIEKAKDKYNLQKKSVEEQGLALLGQGKAISKTKMSSKELISAMKLMLPAYAKMKGEVKTLTKYQSDLNGKHKFSAKEMEGLVKLYPELDGVKLETLNTDKKLRDAIAQTIDKRKKEKKADVDTANSALKTVAKKVDADKKASKSAKKLMGTKKNAEEVIQKAMESTNGKTKETTRLTDDLTKSVNKIPAKKPIDIPIITHGLDKLDKISAWMKKKWDKNVNIHVKKTLSTVGGWVKDAGDFLRGDPTNGSVAIGSSAGQGISSASVATGTVGNGIPVMGLGAQLGAVVDASKASAKPKPKADPNANARVDDQVWRYWNTEDAQSRLETAMKDLERAITLAKDDQKKLIDIYNKQLANDSSQKKNLGTYRSQKDSEANSVLNSLKKYGFHVNTSTNTISNLSHAKDLKGTNAEKANDLLSKWHSINGEIVSINEQIKDLDASIADLKEKKHLAYVQQELDGWKSRLASIDALTTSITNSSAQFDMKLSLIGADDKELALLTNEQAMAKAKSNMSSLIGNFNTLSLKGTKYQENGEQLKQTLDNLGASIKSQADNIIKYRQAINDLEFQRVIDDMNEFGNALNNNLGKNDNNIKNLQEGLLSGTKLGDLKSANPDELDLSRKNAFETLAQQRINLEKEVDDALTAYAKKNIDRTKGVSDTTLKINYEMYNDLLKMKADYTAGKKVSATTIKTKYGDLAGIGNLDEDYAKVAQKLEKYFADVTKKQAELKNQYDSEMAKTHDPQQRKEITDQYIIDSMGIDIDYYNAQIKGNNKAIKEIQAELDKGGLTEDEVQKRNDQIAQYQQQNIDSQNKIKDTIRSRYEFEFSLMDDLVKKQADVESGLQSTLDLLTAVGGDTYGSKGTLLNALFGAEQDKNSQIKLNIADLQSQMTLLQEGSFEWNILNDELAQYNQQLNDSNMQLVTMNKNILANSFDATTRSIEETLFNGKSHDAWSTHQQLWLSGLEKELALEKMYQRMADLGTTVNKEKLDLLDKQEEVSAFEMDYLNKQLDIIQLQQKVDNINRQRTVQTLQQNKNGGWDWVYTADATEVQKAKDDLTQAQIDLQKMEDKAKEDYLTQLQKILQDAENGQYDSVDSFKGAIGDLDEAFKGILDKYPDLGANIEDLANEYAKYLDANGNILKGTPTDTYLVQATQTMADELKNTFTDISSQLGEIFANAIIAKLPNTSVNANRAVTSGNTAISIDKLEFPNVTDGKGLQDAILGLPQLAMQKARSKN